METTRDLGCADLWAKSLERSLARRGRPRRTSIELYRLKPERDLASPRPLRESSAYWQIRRTAAQRAAMPLSSAGGGATLALLAATTLPSVLGGRGTGAAVHAPAAAPARVQGKLTAAIIRARATSKGRHGTTPATKPPSPSATKPVETSHAAGTAASAARTAASAAQTSTAAHTSTAATTSEFAAVQHPTTAGHAAVSHAAPAASAAVLTGSIAGEARTKTPATARPAAASTSPTAAGATTAGVTSDAAHVSRSQAATGGATLGAEPVAPATHVATTAAGAAKKATSGATHAASGSIHAVTHPATAATHGATGTVHAATHAATGTTRAATDLPTGGAAAPGAGAVRATPRTPPRTPIKATPHPAASALTGVRALQQRLGVTVDGDFGPATMAAVEAFQRAHGLSPTGIVDSATRTALGLGPGPVLKEAGAYATPIPTSPTAALGQPTSPTGGSSLPNPGPASELSAEIAKMVTAGNAIATTPYVYGGGHGSFASVGYDCSGSVSYVLHAAGLLSSPEDSSALESYGAPGPGRYVTIYANAGHAWMTIDGRRFDTIALQETGTRWSSSMGSTAGYVVRHPIGL